MAQLIKEERLAMRARLELLGFGPEG